MQKVPPMQKVHEEESLTMQPHTWRLHSKALIDNQVHSIGYTILTFLFRPNFTPNNIQIQFILEKTNSSKDVNTVKLSFWV